MSAKIRKGDLVRVASGRDRGKEGKVLSILRAAGGGKGGKALVEGCNLVAKHQRPTPKNPQAAGVAQKEAPLPLARLRAIDPKSKTATRVGFRIESDGTKVRVARSRRASGSVIAS